MAKPPLMTILHISDIHIGEVDAATGDATSMPVLAHLLANYASFDGLLGHHARGLQDLEAFYVAMRRAGENPVLITSGDITRFGGGPEFDAADDYLVSRLDLNPPNGNYVGLRYQNWRDTAIPGNHDHWPGSPSILGGPSAALAAYFPPGNLPYVHDFPLLPNRRRLRLIGIDTDSGVQSRGLNRVRAVGSFQTQLAGAAPLLGAKQPDEIRVLLMHHSYNHRGWVLGIDRGSRAALDQFLFAHGIRIVLTGHTHRPLVQQFIPQVHRAYPVLECRCGTTTQQDQVPYQWRNLFGNLPARQWPENTLLVHRLEDDNGTTRWSVETFVRTRSQGFVTVGPRGQAQIIV
jgi:Calcineurin-like phosphoesterase